MTSYTQNCPQYTTSYSSGYLSRLLNWSRRTIQRQALKQTISIERAQLKRLSPEMLKDIGIDQFMATQEATRIGIPASRITATSACSNIQHVEILEIGKKIRVY